MKKACPTDTAYVVCVCTLHVAAALFYTHTHARARRYMGSANCSQNAWGRLQHANTYLRIGSYEAGVVVSTARSYTTPASQANRCLGHSLNPMLGVVCVCSWTSLGAARGP